MSLSGDKGVAQFKKSVKMGHPTGYTMIGPGSNKTESGGRCGLAVANISHVLPQQNIVTPQLLTSTGKLGSFESVISLFTKRKTVNGRVF